MSHIVTEWKSQAGTRGLVYAHAHSSKLLLEDPNEKDQGCVHYLPHSLVYRLASDLYAAADLARSGATNTGNALIAHWEDNEDDVGLIEADHGRVHLTIHSHDRSVTHVLTPCEAIACSAAFANAIVMATTDQQHQD